MSSPFNAPLRRLAEAPRAFYLLPATAIAAAVLVTGPGHHASPLASAESDSTAASTPTAASDAATAGSVQREPVLSRSAERIDTSAKHAKAHTHKAHKGSAHHHKAKHHKAKAKGSHGPTAPSNAARTVAAAKQSTINVPGRCLQWSREQADIPSKYGDAATAWQHATGKRPKSQNPPRGAAVYWTGGSHGYGHIAISVGHHKVRSSDAGGTGRVATVSISHLSKKWHLKYAGWANSINGYKIPGVTA